jgi:putative ABC transport system substrate-binding protein
MSDRKNSQRKTQKARALLAWIIVPILLLSACGTVQPSKETYHVGIIYTSDSFLPVADGFKAKLTELGYVEGEKITYELQMIDTDANTPQAVAERFVAAKKDLIFAIASGPAVAARQATEGTDIPAIFAFATTEGNNLVNSVSEPGGNLTGVRYPGPELTAKRFELLHQMVPSIERLYVTYEEAYPTSKYALEALRPVAEAAGVTLVEEPITSAENIVANLQARAQAEDIGMDAILIIPENYTQSPTGWAAINEFAATHHLPIGGNTAAQTKAGALFNYAPSLDENGRQASLLADKIFKGTPVGTIPVVTPESQLILNYKVAQSLGLTVPEGLLKQAVEIIR